jgi:6-phosphogluconolactonase
MNIRLKTFPSTEELIIQCLEMLRRILPTLEACDGVMLSGGRTPLELYRRAAAEGLSTSGKLFLSDERYVPADDPQSNYGTIHPFFPGLLKINTGLSLEAAAQAFETDLNALKKIPLGLLGLGTDGHTASLFTIEDAALRDKGLAIPVIKNNKPDRISVTPALLNRIGKVVILASGAEKIKIIQTLLEHPDTIPAGVALADHPDTEIWTDHR